MGILREEGLGSLETGWVRCWVSREVSHKASVQVF